jgi:hypothetical protein
MTLAGREFRRAFRFVLRCENAFLATKLAFG